jgi:hypothetical protein
VKFHTTLKDIVVAILVLLSCTVVVWWGVANLGMTNPSQSFAAYLLERIDGDGDMKITVGSVARNWLRTFTICDVSVTIEGDEIAHFDELRVSGGARRIALALLKRGTQLDIEVDGLTISLDEGALALFSADSSAPSRPLERLRLYIQAADADIALALPSLEAHLSGGGFTAMIDGGVANLTVAGSADVLSVSQNDGQGRVEQLRYGIDETGRLALEAEKADWSSPSLFLQTSNLVMAAQQQGGLSLSADELRLEMGDLAVASPQVVVHAAIEEGEVAEFTVSLSALDVASQSWSFAAPALASSGSRSESGTHTLAVASRSDEDFHFQSELLGTFNANTLGGRFIYEVPSTIRGELTFATLAWDEQLTAHNVIVSLSDVDAKRVDIAGSVTARLQMVLTEGLGTIETDLVANITLHRESAALTATVDFIDAQSSLLASPVDVHLSLQGRGEEAQVEAKVVIPDQAELSALYNQGDGERTVMMSGRLTDLRAGTFRQLMDAYTPFLKPYIHDDTRLSGNIAFSGSDGSGGREGRLSTELALLEAHVGNFDLDAGFTFTGTLDGDRLTVSPMTLATSGYRLAFSGETEVGHWLPRGELSLSRTDDGQLLAHATMVDRPPSSYEFSLVTAIEPIITVDGLVGKQTTNSLTGQGLLTMLDDAVPFTFDLATDTLELSVVQEERLLLHASLAPPQRLVMQADRFLVPGTSTSFSGTLEARYANLFDWSARSSDFALDSVTIKGRRYSLTAPFSASSAEILIPTFTIGVEGTRSTGSFFYRGFDLARLKASGFVAPYEVALQIDDLLSLSLIGDERRLEMAASIKNLPLGRLMNTADDASLSLSLVGATDFTTLLSYDGSLSYQNDTASFSTRFTADESHLELFDTAFRAGEFTVDGEKLRFDSGAISAALIAEHVRHLSYIDQRSHLKVTAALQLPQTETLFDLVKKGGLLLGEELAATLSITDVLLLGEGGIADGLYHLRWKDGALSGESELLTFSYDTKSGHFTLSADPEFGIGINAYGSLSAKDFGVVATNIRLPLVMLNRTFLKPIFLFKSGYGEGEITLGGTKDAIRPYGQLFVNATEMFVFWLPDDQINMKGVSVTIDGNRATTGRVPFFSTNAKTGQTVHGFGNLSAHFDGLSLLNYEIHADDVDHPVFLWIPMAGQEVDIQGYAQGTFNLFGIGFETWLDGDVTISDMSMTMGIKGLPYWYEPAYVTSTSFNVKTGKGVKFFYPNSPNPIISATLTENQSFSFTYDHLTDEFEVDGTFAFRSGEIYYFQKNFFITEGSMVLHTDAISGSSAVIPRINLRAKVTDFDSVGNRVDIFLVLRDSTLTSLNPYFESIPTKEVNEIMEILGQSILPTGAYGEIGLYSVASLAAAATDVAERLGLLELSQTAQLTETIRISLGLDMFSIRSNIVQNILFDALPVTGVMGTLSPIARYLHNTSIFMGKYIGTNFFLQALVHLSAMERSKVGSSFLSPDLSIDLELSLDWENPLATISFFTQPSELSFTNILDTMGFSVTKRIVLR